MSESTVTVASVEDKQTKNGKPFKSFVDGEGQSWNVFPFKVKDAYGLVVPGNVLKLTWEQSGDYKNIDHIEFMEKVEPPKPVRASNSPDDEAWRNVRTAVMQTMDAWTKGKLEDDHMLVKEALHLCMTWMYSISRGGVMPEGTAEVGGHLKEAAKEHGAVEKRISNLGELRAKLKELGFEEESDQKRACALQEDEPWSNLKGQYQETYDRLVNQQEP